MSDRVLAVVGRGVVDVTAPILRGDDLGVTRGDGIFETMRVRNQSAFLFDDHLRRMAVSAGRMALRLPSRADWRATVGDALSAYGDDTGVLRLFTTRGPDGEDAPFSYLTVAPVPAATIAVGRDGARAITLAAGVPAMARAEAGWLLGGVKTTSYAVAMAAKREAESRGATDAIWISSDGEVLEEATSSVVWVSAGAAYTVPAVTGILTGTTLDCVRAVSAAAGRPISDRRTTIEELRAADEILLLSAVRGVAFAKTLNGATVGGGSLGPVGTLLRNLFETAFDRATSAGAGTG
jgi:4-amino-4-deoxychorismate lyase